MARHQTHFTLQEMEAAEVRDRSALRDYYSPGGRQRYYELHGQSYDEHRGSAPDAFLIAAPEMDMLCITFARQGVPAPEALAEMDAQWDIRDGSVRSEAAYARRWGWSSRSPVRRLLARLRSPAKAARPSRPGLVYFIGADHGPIKIGWTIGTADARLRALQTGSPIPLACLATFAGEAWLERRLHAHLTVDRLHGEWFERIAALALIERLNTGWRP